MSEQGRKTWYVGEANSYLGWEIMEGGDHGERCRGHINVRGVAQQIADDHNRIPELEASVVDMRDKLLLERERRVEMEQRAERVEAALRTLVQAIRKVPRRKIDMAAHLEVDQAIEQARAALPDGDAETTT